jgi:hypothetical protein
MARISGNKGTKLDGPTPFHWRVSDVPGLRYRLRSAHARLFFGYNRVMPGRLIRATKFRRDANAVNYIVAEPNGAAAIKAVAAKLGEDLEFEDLGRVTDDLLRVLQLEPGAIRQL